jgi:hypothetical protein
MVGDGETAGSKEEHDILVKACLEEVALMGFPAWENQRRAVEVKGRWVSLSKSGRGDIHVIISRLLDGNLFGIHGELEIKTGQSGQAGKQRAHMRVVRNSGGVYLVIRDRLEIAPKLAALGFQPRNPDYRPSAGPVFL